MTKCIVYGCKNYKHQGTFVGNLCGPCYSMLISGNINHGETFIHALRDRIKATQKDATMKWNEMTSAEQLKIPQHILEDPTNPLHIPWGSWTRAAKGALLLASYEGGVVQEASRFAEGWHTVLTPRSIWDDNRFYRIPPQPTRETRKLYMQQDYGLVYIGTVDVIDKKPDHDSVRLEIAS